jgi:ubiquinone/menaquinone biosynthesis C-methylase UbiE
LADNLILKLYKMAIKDSYNIWANIYDTNINPTRDLDKQVTVKTLQKYSFDNVLELGCGTGKNTEFLNTKAQKIISLDFSDQMLAKAKSKITYSKVTFKQADLIQKCPVKDHFADLVTCSLTLEHIKNLNHIFKEAKSKLKPKGLFFISELHPFKQYVGSKARFETEKGTIILDTFIHHTSDYLKVAENNGFKLIELKEWFDEKDPTLPRLISFVFSL